MNSDRKTAPGDLHDSQEPRKRDSGTLRGGRDPETMRGVRDPGTLRWARDPETPRGVRDPETLRRVIGKTVRGRIDRPLGSRHPRFPDLIYPVNYGYVEGVLGGDGEEQDAYVLGADGPLETFEGTVIAVVHRLDDAEDKWIVSLSPSGRDYTDEEILELTRFQERFFRSVLIR